MKSVCLLLQNHYEPDIRVRRKAEALQQEKLQSLTGGLPLPPGLKLF